MNPAVLHSCETTRVTRSTSASVPPPSLARLYRRTGASAAADPLAAATALYRALDMPAWVEEAARLDRT